jgi:biotin transporter BioY
MDITMQLAIQWQNASNILFLLFFIGGDIIKNAIAQLCGVYVQPSRNWPRLYLTPVAFSFG